MAGSLSTPYSIQLSINLMWEECLLAHFLAAFVEPLFHISFTRSRRAPKPRREFREASRISTAISPTEPPGPSPSFAVPIGCPILARHRDVSCSAATVADLPPHQRLTGFSLLDSVPVVQAPSNGGFATSGLLPVLSASLLAHTTSSLDTTVSRTCTALLQLPDVDLSPVQTPENAPSRRPDSPDRAISAKRAHEHGCHTNRANKTTDRPLSIDGDSPFDTQVCWFTKRHTKTLRAGRARGAQDHSCFAPVWLNPGHSSPDHVPGDD